MKPPSPGIFLVMCILFIWVIYPKIESMFLPRDPLLLEIQRQLSTLHPKLYNIELYEGVKSYTLNKKYVYICLKNPQGHYYGRNMLVYVVLHEYAHIINDEIGHTSKFFEIFNQLLSRATDMGLYDPDIPPVKSYCGTN